MAYTQQAPVVANILTNAPADIFLVTLDAEQQEVESWLGMTQGDTEINPERTFEGMQCEQEIGDIGQILTDEKCSITGNLLEATLTNLELVLGSATGFGSKTFTSAKFIIRSQGIGATTRTISVWKGVISTGTKYVPKKGKEVLVPIKIICSKDPDQDDGEEYYKLEDVAGNYDRTAHVEGNLTVSNILTNAPADIFISPNTFLGSTQGDTEINPERTFEGVQCEQMIGDIDQMLTDEKLSISGTLLEATIANLKYALDSGTGSGFGSSNATERTFLIKSKGIDGSTRTISVWKGIIGTGTKYVPKKGKEVLVPFKIICSKDVTKTDGQKYFSIAEAS